MSEDTYESIFRRIQEFCYKYGLNSFTHGDVRHLGVMRVDLIQLAKLGKIEYAGVSGYQRIYKLRG